MLSIKKGGNKIAKKGIFLYKKKRKRGQALTNFLYEA